MSQPCLDICGQHYKQNAARQFNLGMLLISGNGVPQDMQEGSMWLEKVLAWDGRKTWALVKQNMGKTTVKPQCKMDQNGGSLGEMQKLSPKSSGCRARRAWSAVLLCCNVWLPISWEMSECKIFQACGFVGTWCIPPKIAILMKDMMIGHECWGVPDWQRTPDISSISYLYRHLQIGLEMSFNSSSTNHYKPIGSYCIVQIVQQHPWDATTLALDLADWGPDSGTCRMVLTEIPTRRAMQCGWSLLWTNDQTWPDILFCWGKHDSLQLGWRA